MAATEAKLPQIKALLDGETPDFEIEGARHKITFLNPELKLINLRDEIKLHVSAYGPRGRALTARLGAGWLNFVGDVDTGVAAMKAMSTEDPLFGNGVIRADGRKVHPMYLLQVKTPAESKSEWDVFRVVGTIPADKAFRPLNEGGCPLAKN